MEIKITTYHNQLSRQDNIVLRLQDEIEDFKRKTSDLQSQLRETEIRFGNLEGKLKDERLMARIKEAENTQNVAELRQQISHLELKNEEMAALSDLNLSMDGNGNEDTGELQEQIDCLTAEVTRLTKLKTETSVFVEKSLIDLPTVSTSSSVSSPSVSPPPPTIKLDTGYLLHE